MGDDMYIYKYMTFKCKIWNLDKCGGISIHFRANLEQ